MVIRRLLSVLISTFPVSRLALLAFFVALGFVSDGFGQRIFKAVLDGVQEIPAVATTGTGKGTVVLNAAETHISYRLEFSGLGSSQTAAHIHGAAARGASAGVLFNIGSNGATSDIFFAESVAITAGQVADLKNGLLYFNVHSTINGGGEIRGQIEPDCTQLASGLVSWYQGEGNTFDQNALNNGTLQGGVTYVGGSVGRTFRLGGNGNASNSGDRVIVGNPANLQLQNFTIEAWVRRQSSTITTNSPVAGFENGTIFAYGQNGYGLVILQSTGLPALTKVGVDQINSTGAAITDTNFHHLAVTKSGNQVIFYVDGAASTPITYNSTFSFTTSAAIGARGDSDARNAFFGDVDELSIFNRALSASEIASIRNAGAAGKCPPCVAPPVGLAEWWTGDGNLLGVRNRNNGVLFNSATYAEGRNGHAFRFDRDAGQQHVSVPDSNSLDVTTQFTFDAWIKPESLHPGGTLNEGGVISKLGGTPSNYAYQFGITSGNTGIFCLFNAIGDTTWPNNLLNATVPGGVPVGQWSHIACTYDNSSMRAYFNGVLVGTTSVGPKTVLNSTATLRISGDENNNVFFDGLIEEPHVFSRALSATEIAAVVNAGRSCFCKPGATTAPTNIVGWWGGDGGANDISGNNNHGTPQNGALHRVAKVGQGFQFNGATQFVNVPDSPVLNPTAQVSLDAWVYPTANTNGSQAMEIIVNKEVSGVATVQYEISRRLAGGSCPTGGGIPTGNFAFYLGGVTGLPDNCGGWVDSFANLSLNTWSHVALTYDGANARAYVNGVVTRTVAASGSITVGSGPFRIGGRSNLVSEWWVGSIDEVSIYNRGLSAAEVASIYDAGLAGKLKNAATAVGLAEADDKGGAPTRMERTDAVLTPESPLAVNVTVGDATITFPGVTTAGITQQIPLSFAGLPAPSLESAGLTYDISTTAVYSGSPVVCFNLPSFTAAQFSNLRILHFENDSWIDRTNLASTYDDLCTTALPSLSPFAIINLIPSAALVTLSGRVTTADGRGIRNVRVSLTDQSGNVRPALTSSFGYYFFEDITAGQTVVISVAAKRYIFLTPTRILTVDEGLAEIDFTAEP